MCFTHHVHTYYFLQLRNITCVNLTKFYGLTINNSVLYIITEACSRGTLKVRANCQPTYLSSNQLMNRNFNLTDVIEMDT